MGRRRLVTAEVALAIQSRRRAGVSYKALAKEFGISEGSIGTALRGRVGDREPKVAAMPRERAPRTGPGCLPPMRREAGALAVPALEGDGEAVDEPGGAVASGDVLDLLRRIAARLEQLLATTSQADVDVVTKLVRSLNQTLALVARLTPPEPPPLEDSPDMVEAARLCGEKLLAAVERARGTA